jgi:hypothetical protein
MNDTELDELLSRWNVPTARAELRGEVWRAFRPPRRPRFWGFALKPMFAGTALGAGVCLLLLVTQALPQTLRVASPLFRIPFTVDSEFVDHETDGSSKVEVVYTTYLDNGNEVVLSSYMPGHPVITAVRRVLESTSFIWGGIVGRYHWAGHADFVRSGCLIGGKPVVERISILGYQSVGVEVSRPGDTERMTWWYAPDLDCFVLKMRTEERQPDGSYRVVKEKHALSISRTGDLPAVR